MRIVGGEFRGRSLASPQSQSIRPTSDRLRESLFNVLAHGYGDPVAGARVLDLFAGTGALGLEAMSRGAAFGLFVDEGVEARGLVRRNVEALGLTGRTKLFRRDATKLGPAGTVAPFDIVFADPPYRRGLGELALVSALGGGWMKPGTLVILEEASDTEVSTPNGLELIERREAGETQLLFYRWAAGDENLRSPSDED
ncbi:16S rRNA (guanine(966)-N(2))-methyltransferase RsmD [Kaistia algarum]|uniref:16S rRNA (guanine(966)-N(2))-methyltransferase RsmD n=1 Tax=Kaistia algarum TaxID=2083279 RepID=UPI0022518517|nr:16S rRNA (guanine(966)-N(2))-methyltransferase RsmD [Kaistia algarum]MCX5512454.1 16S rRNA (guanine(966)-N(2))-methyltransferase RsmD [Kaistia algarum]